ncbi:methyltransferase domain-containing protein [Streptomyces pratens]|uniref:Protein-L-isoaspartate O-methyltransferase n=1 Tax=Streptomyces pratens TaxID=887456 RepID=A0ABW1M4I2_9ACTN
MNDKELRARLIERLTGSGHLRTGPWREAVSAVPRHEFLREGFFREVDGSTPTAWTPVMRDDPRWLEACYDDVSLVTQVAGTVVPGTSAGEILRAPTSSSTMPGLVVRMLEDLQVDVGHRVLEIGTGTGYSTALMCHRLGDDSVTSVEVDEDVSTRARTALGHCGFTPDLIVGDGLAGYKDGAPYDRVIATCGLLTVPRELIEQTRPGGIVLVTLCGWLYSSELARLTVHEDGTASGRFLGGQISFMLARPHLPPPLTRVPHLRSAPPAPRGGALHSDENPKTDRPITQPLVQERLRIPQDVPHSRRERYDRHGEEDPEHESWPRARGGGRCRPPTGSRAAAAVVMPRATTPTTSSRAARTAVGAPSSPRAKVPFRSRAGNGGGSEAMPARIYAGITTESHFLHTCKQSVTIGR